MTRVAFDAATIAKMPRLAGVVEITDEQGRLLGYFHATSSALGKKPVSPMSRDELERRRKEPAGPTLREVIDELRQS